ncbi:cupin domain-containing protein [Donghicola mangrovi]|uniref:Cupin domain-containing protein n=1 Tax=Donghicola mangrovi TaxID=2729614 RepID=A0A850QES3_9RHOB|nr:cupin domain-containing protein [Donghicola mangrovi]NVO25448.1 cupin domain-containing protein [Donghicola mangrovi]
MKTLLPLACAATLSTGAAQAADVVSHGSTEAVMASQETFTGAVIYEPLLPANELNGHNTGMVTFPPGARTAWHSHPRGQTLIVTSGHGWIQERDGDRIEIRTGDTVWCPPNVEHWHGATDSSLMSHIALTYFEGDTNVTWGELVSDDEYALTK